MRSCSHERARVRSRRFVYMKQSADRSSSHAHDERATQWRDETLAVIAHELRDPLHTIAVGLETMLKLQLGDERAARQLVVMQRTVGRMSRLILDLLDVTRIEAGNVVLAREHVEVQSLLDEVLELFEAPARQRSISLTCHAPRAMPCVIGERDRLLRVLSNLVGNAVKFTPPCGRISVHARLSASQHDFTQAAQIPWCLKAEAHRSIPPLTMFGHIGAPAHAAAQTLRVKRVSLQRRYAAWPAYRRPLAQRRRSASPRAGELAPWNGHSPRSQPADPGQGA